MSSCVASTSGFGLTINTGACGFADRWELGLLLAGFELSCAFVDSDLVSRILRAGALLISAKDLFASEFVPTKSLGVIEAPLFAPCCVIFDLVLETVRWGPLEF